jgi:hypothetical protein
VHVIYTYVSLQFQFREDRTGTCTLSGWRRDFESSPRHMLCLILTWQCKILGRELLLRPKPCMRDYSSDLGTTQKTRDFFNKEKKQHQNLRIIIFLSCTREVWEAPFSLRKLLSQPKPEEK